MVRRAVCGVWALAVVCVGGVPRAASATSGGAYDVPRECPARAEWLQALRARLPPLLRTHPLVEAQRVHIERVDGAAGTEYEGSLASAGEAGSADPRPVVRGATCAELIDVLSFMGALGLERVAAAPAPTKAASHESLSLLSVEALPSAGADRAASVGDAENASAFRAGATAFALLQTGIAPGRSLDFGVGGRLEWSLPGWQPLVLLGFYSGRASEVSVDGSAKVRFEHWSTQAVACAWRFPSRGTLAFRPCVDFDVGMTRGEGFGVAGAEEHSVPWVSAGAQLRFELALWDRIELGTLLGATKPLYHARFFIKPSSTAFETADFGFRTGTYASILF